MTRENLIATAKALPQVKKPCLDTFAQIKDRLVDLMNQKMEVRQDLQEMIGPHNLAMMKDNHANHIRFMESIFAEKSPEVLVDTILWVFRAYRSRNFSSTYWAAQMNAWIEIYRKELSDECYQQIYPFYYWMQINIPHFNKLAEENLEKGYSEHV